INRQAREIKNAEALEDTKSANIHYGIEKKIQQAFQEAKIYLRGGQPVVLSKKVEERIISDSKKLEKSLAKYDERLEEKFEFAIKSDDDKDIERSAKFFMEQFVLNLKSKRGNEIEHEWGSMDRFDPDIDKNEDIVNMVKAIESDESSIEIGRASCRERV